MRTLRVLAVLAALTLPLAACGSDDDGGDAAAPTTEAPADSGSTESAITVEDFAFSPATVTVEAGAEVTVTNDDSAAHTWTSDDDDFDVELAQGGSGSHTFDEPGTYVYHCEIHSSMKGEVVVE